MRILIMIIAVCLALATLSSDWSLAQMLLLDVGTGGMGGGSAGGCAGAGQLDFSNSCNTIFFTGAMTP